MCETKPRAIQIGQTSPIPRPNALAHQSFALRKRSAFEITLTELRLIAAPAIIELPQADHAECLLDGRQLPQRETTRIGAHSAFSPSPISYRFSGDDLAADSQTAPPNLSFSL